MRSALAIAGTNVRRLFRDRTAIFFVFVFPFLIILAIGAVFGEGFTPKLGLVAWDGGPLEGDLVERLRSIEDLDVEEVQSEAQVVEAVERGELEAGVVIPQGYDDALTSSGEAALRFVSRPAGVGQELRLTVASAVAAEAAVVRAARFAQREARLEFPAALETARRLAEGPPAVNVRVSVAGEEEATQLGTFDFGAAQQLVLFMFVTSLSASSQLIQTRRLGLSRRMLATPTPAGTVVVGEGLGRFGVAMLQGLIIVAVSFLLFGVDWGDPVASLALVVAFALVGTGAAMLMGSVLDNADQAGSLGVFLGLGLAALGGCMVPLEVFPPAMERVAHLTPHAWAVDGFIDVVGEGATVVDVLPQLGVLFGYAAILLVVASVLFRRSITGTAASPA
jgi:ABC-2 type transport system permease protein